MNAQNPMATAATTLIFVGLVCMALGVGVWLYDDLLKLMVSGAFVLFGLLLMGLGGRLRAGPPNFPGGMGGFGGMGGGGMPGQ